MVTQFYYYIWTTPLLTPFFIWDEDYGDDMIDVGGYKDILDDAANDLTIAADSKRCHSLKTVVDGQYFTANVHGMQTFI